MSLTANGCFAQSDESHPVPKEILSNFAQSVGRIGNLIIGRRTYEQMRAGIARDAFSKIELVIVSHSPCQAGGPKILASPREALHHLEQKDFGTALIGGGAQLDSSFLSQGLVGEIYLNIYPAIVSKGINLPLNGPLETGLQLIDSLKLSDNIIQLHYRVEK